MCFLSCRITSRPLIKSSFMTLTCKLIFQKQEWTNGQHSLLYPKIQILTPNKFEGKSYLIVAPQLKATILSGHGFKLDC